MQFFKLTHPEYETDDEAEHRNPIRSIATHRIPGIACALCGPWASSSRLRVPVPDEIANELEQMRFLPVMDWTKALPRWASQLHIAAERIEPGAKLGPPVGVCAGTLGEDAVHPIPGEIWVTRNVREAIVRADLQGLSFANVQLSKECGTGHYMELVVHGRAWRKGSTPATLERCNSCGRIGFPSPKNLFVDESRWDGSDFFIVDKNPNIILMSERAAFTIEAGRFTNLAAKAIE